MPSLAELLGNWLRNERADSVSDGLREVDGFSWVADNSGMVRVRRPGSRWRRIWAPALIAACFGSWSPSESKSQGEPELFPGRAIARCEAIERPAMQSDAPLATRIPVLAEPQYWLDAPGPHGERAKGWQGRR